MISKIRLSEAIFDDHVERQKRERILKEDLFTTQKDVVQYYESNKDLEGEQIEKDERPCNDSASPRPSNQYNINQFLKLPRALRQFKKKKSTKSLVDYFQSQQLTIDHCIFGLKNIAIRKTKL